MQREQSFETKKVGKLFGVGLINVSSTIDVVIVCGCKILNASWGPSFAFGSFPFHIILDLFIWKKNQVIMTLL